MLCSMAVLRRLFMVKSTLGIERLFYFEQLENGLREWAKRGFSAPLSTQPQPRAVDVSAERGKRKRTEKSQVGRLFKVFQSFFFTPRSPFALLQSHGKRRKLFLPRNP